jgi:tripartite-type tricarboxylate transporter receptor subunit TctC
MIRRRITMAAIAMAGMGLTGPAAAQGYPSHNIELVVPATPGSSADIVGRVLAEGMTAKLGQPIIIQNKAGAAGMLGAAEVARAKPDGYTMLHGAVYSLTVQPLTERQSTYTRKSFDGICQTFKNDQVIVARPNTYNNLADILTASKAKPGGLNYGSPGLTTIPHLSMIELGRIAKVEFNHVPFRGPAESIQMTLGGQIDFAVAPLTAAASSGLAMPALFAEKRNASIPDVPTVIEQGYDVAPLSIGGLFVPAGTPADIKSKLDDACVTSMKSEAFQKVAKNTLQPADFMADSAGFTRNIDKDLADKQKLLTALGLAK